MIRGVKFFILSKPIPYMKQNHAVLKINAWQLVFHKTKVWFPRSHVDKELIKVKTPSCSCYSFLARKY